MYAPVPQPSRPVTRDSIRSRYPTIAGRIVEHVRYEGRFKSVQDIYKCEDIIGGNENIIKIIKKNEVPRPCVCVCVCSSSSDRVHPAGETRRQLARVCARALPPPIAASDCARPTEDRLVAGSLRFSFAGAREAPGPASPPGPAPGDSEPEVVVLREFEVYSVNRRVRSYSSSEPGPTAPDADGRSLLGPSRGGARSPRPWIAAACTGARSIRRYGSSLDVSILNRRFYARLWSPWLHFLPYSFKQGA